MTSDTNSHKITEAQRNAVTSAQPAAATSEQLTAATGKGQHGQARVDDSEPEPLTGQGQRSRDSTSRLRSFYTALRVKTEVDPLALVTFIAGIGPATLAAWYWLTPVVLNISPPDKVTFKAESQLIELKAVDIVRIAGTFTFENKHQTKKVTVSDLTATMRIGDKVGHFQAGSYIHSWRDEDDSKKHRITSLGDFGQFTIPADTIQEPKEVYFYAKPSEDKSQRFKYAYTVDEFRSKVDAGEKIEIVFSANTDLGIRKFVFIPVSPRDISSRLSSNYKWDVQEATKK